MYFNYRVFLGVETFHSLRFGSFLEAGCDICMAFLLLGSMRLTASSFAEQHQMQIVVNEDARTLYC